MKRTFRILALILALAMSSMIFAGCDEKSVEEFTDAFNKAQKSNNTDVDPTSTANTADDKEAIEDNVIAFINAFVDLDFDKAQTYVDPNSDDYSDFASIDDVLGDMDFSDAEEFGMSEEEAKDLILSAIKDILLTVDYKVDSVTISGNKATVKVVEYVPDMDNIDDSVIEEKMIELSGYDNFEDYALSIVSLGEDEMMGEILKLYIEASIAAIEDSAYIKNTSTYTIKKVGGQWLVSDWEDAEILDIGDDMTNQTLNNSIS